MAQQELNNNEMKGLLDLSDEELTKEIKIDPTIEGKDFKIDEETGEPVLSTQLADVITELAKAAEKAALSFKDLSEMNEEYQKIQEQEKQEALARLREIFSQSTQDAESVDKVIVNQFAKQTGLNRRGRRRMIQTIKQNRKRLRYES